MSRALGVPSCSDLQIIRSVLPMPMPHRTQMQLIKRRLVGKEGSERVRELRTILNELPGYLNGPYGDIRKWVLAQIEETHKRAHVVQRDSIAVRREGAAQVALVGAPNAGKSSLLYALSDIQIKTGDYAFTTTRPSRPRPASTACWFSWSRSPVCWRTPTRTGAAAGPCLACSAA